MLLETREKSKLTRHDERFIIAPALFAASEQGHDDIVKMFLEVRNKSNFLNHFKRIHINQSLEIASKNGHSTVVKTILETRNTSNFLNQYEPIRIGPALKVATYDEGATIVKALLNTGRTKFDRDDGAWALSLAAEQEGDALVRLLLTSKADCNGAFRERAWKKLPGLRQERPWNCPDPPLEIAAKNGNHAIASLLLDTGKVSADSKRRSLNHAIREGHPAIVDLLLSSGKFGANVGESMLYAASRDKLSVVKLLYEKWKIGLGLTTTDILKDGPIVAAIENGSASVFEYLLDAGKLNVNFEFNWRSRRNRVYRSTLLRKAADDGQLEIMRVLLAKKANVNLRSSKDGATALSVAVRQCRVDIVEIILDIEGVDLCLECDNGLTPRLIAKEYHKRHNHSTEYGGEFGMIVSLMYNYVLSMPNRGEMLRNLETSIVESDRMKLSTLPDMEKPKLEPVWHWFEEVYRCPSYIPPEDRWCSKTRAFVILGMYKIIPPIVDRLRSKK
ncbi:hypothetical protein CGMCC3_g976 [Colletotrichum fructicola]|nr:uncharacterized protein CGMCC3_g976 [Colletotrichum fructicola]KAE9582767.1 hypothetical protein CGMCC3_g976 [Colletotrichum fructicola]